MEFRCKYDPAHGPFSDPRTLGKHYQTEHGQVPKPNTRKRCKICGQEMSSGGVAYHFKTKHGMQSSAGQTETVDGPAHVRCVCGDTVAIGHAQRHAAKHGVTDDWRNIYADIDAPATNDQPLAMTNGRPHSDDPSRCDICGHETKRKNMVKHFQRSHKGERWKLHVVKIGTGAALPVVADLPSMEPVAVFAMHADGNGYIADDFFLPVVAQLAHPGGLVPVEAMPALMQYRDATTLMLQQVTNLRRRAHR